MYGGFCVFVRFFKTKNLLKFKVKFFKPKSFLNLDIKIYLLDMNKLFEVNSKMIAKIFYQIVKFLIVKKITRN